eukprot:TRINITY_DN1167_c0_g1_i4.p1 TRINITY_DN1167_c0_g1~~TRINITY_DN1167_c0_g1_i4.p1  ORF type:complete len:228 (-),score=60.63 TRINITY_DN1167_c0_g1_i4:362-979(-)
MPRLQRGTRLAVAAVAALSCATLKPAFMPLFGRGSWTAASTSAYYRVTMQAGQEEEQQGGVTQLMAKAHDGDVEQLKQLMADGYNVNAQDAYGWTALRYAVRNNQYDATAALLEGGADPNIASHSGRTPLMSAAGNDLAQMVELLINDGGADIMQHDDRGRTAYDIASRGGHMRDQAIRDMVAEGQTPGMLTAKEMEQYSKQVPL